MVGAPLPSGGVLRPLLVEGYLLLDPVMRDAADGAPMDAGWLQRRRQ